MEDATKSEYFSYDNWSRLSAAQTGAVNSTPGTWSLVWGYDRLGNRLSQTLVGGNISIGQPQLTVDQNTNRITNTGYTYDLSGNMTHDANTAYGYDGAGRMISANNGLTPAAYTYFGAQRIKKVVAGTTTITVYSGTKPVAEYVNATLTKEYLYSGSSLLATISGGVATYHHPDHLSNRAETDASGNTPVRTYGHFPFGETWYETGTADKWKFTNYARDTGETNLDYANFRHYGSLIGRFATPDLLAGRLQNPQSLNRYSYSLSDPVNLKDPLGLSTITYCSDLETFINWDKEGNEVEQDVCMAWDTAFIPDSPNRNPNRGGGGGGGGGTPRRPKVDTQALADCIFAEFGVMLASFAPSESGGTGKRADNINGTFTGFGPDLLQLGPEYHYDIFTEIDITNNVQTYSTADITNMFPKAGTTSFGYTDPKSPYTNYGSSDLTDPQEMLQSQIYELGNALSAITGRPGGQSLTDESDAKALQDCYNKKTGDQPIH